VISARIVSNFDLELVDKNFNWFGQKVFMLWRKNPLIVTVKDTKNKYTRGKLVVNKVLALLRVFVIFEFLIRYLSCTHNFSPNLVVF
jgi:hypothetical protein